jgi:hypothetical protein
VYLTGREYSISKGYFANIVKLTCSENGELSGVKAVKVASCTVLLASNINYLCTRVGNKVVVYHADTLYKVASVNVGMCIYDGIIKGGNLVLRTGDGDGEIRVSLKHFRKKVMTGPVEMLDLPSNLLVT